MRIFAIGDLHMSNSVDKPMDIFGEHWIGHEEKIFDYWKKNVSDDDIVLVAGDISWASSLDDAIVDLDIISSMPGKKFLIKGNHDYWWSTATALNKLYGENMVFMNTKYENAGKYTICATRGWLCPNDVKFDEKDESIYKREANRLKISLEGAKKDGCENIIVMLHYPPTNEKFEPSLFTEVIEKYSPKAVIYGHLHGHESFDMGLKGNINGIEYFLVSSDYLDFKLMEVCNE